MEPLYCMPFGAGLRDHLRSQFSLLIDWNSCLGEVCEMVVTPGDFLEQNLACRTGGKGVIHHVTTAGAGKRADFLALTAG